MVILFTLGIISFSSAQTFPVQVATNIIPPYSLKLTDYGTTNRFYTTVLFNDPIRFDLMVKFKVIIKGQGITIQTKPEYNPPPVFLQSGIPEQYSSIDFADYFNPNNLNFQGVDRSKLSKSGLLPEGVYSICIEVYEYTQNKKVSNSGCSMAWMVLNDPPIINYPRNFEKLLIQNPQQVVFNWTPRHTGSPNSAFATEYELEIVEMRSGNKNANNAMVTSLPIASITTQQTSFIYGLSETLLIPGQQYAFRVRAKPTIENEYLDLFKNNGYSEVFTFTYGEVCLPPAAFKVEANSAMSFISSWEQGLNHSSYEIQYRENNKEAKWYQKSTFGDEVTVDGLKSNTEYQVKIMGQCGVIASEQSEVFIIKTKEIAENTFVCGSQDNQIDLSNTRLIQALEPATFIHSGDFKVKLLEVANNGDGTFSGKGIAIIPWLKQAGIKVQFKNIKVNEDRVVIAGNIGSIQSDNSRWVYTPTSIDDKKNETTNNTNSSQNNTTTNQASDSDHQNNQNTTTNDTTSTNNQDIAGTNNQTENTNNSTVTSENTDNSTGSANGTSTSGGSTASTSSNGSNNSSGLGDSGSSNTNSGASNNQSVAEKWNPNKGEFGPIKVTFTEAPKKLLGTSDQTCSYESKASFNLTLKEENGVSLPVEFKNVTVVYSLNCGDESLKSATFNWHDPTQPLTASFGLVSGTVQSLSLDINSKKEITGTVNLKTEVTKDISFSDIPNYKNFNTPLDITLKKGLNGSCSFAINHTSSTGITGKWDFSGITNLNLDLTNDKEPIAQLKNASLNKSGIASGVLKVNKPLNWKNDQFEMILELQSLDVQFSPFKGFESWAVNSGKMGATIKNMKGINGEFTSQLNYQNSQFVATATSKNLSGFGMSVENIDLTAQFSKYLSFESIKGKFDVKHPEFDTKVQVTAFEFLPTGLEKLNLQGEFMYGTHQVKLQNTTYKKTENLLLGSASVVSGSGKEKSILSVESFKIHSDGKIEMGAISGDFNSGELFGPLRVTMQIPKSTEKDSEGYNIYNDIKGSFLLNLNADDKKVEELAISEALVSFKRHPETGKFKDVDITWEGDIAIGKVGFVNSSIKKINLKVDKDGMLSGIITANALLEENVSMKAYLGQNESSDLDLVLHKDLKGQVEFHFSGGNNFNGEWKLNKLENLNGDLKKGGENIATFRNGNLNEKQLLTGNLKAVTNASYKNKHCKIEISALDMGFSISLEEGIKSFKITEGQGSMILSEMENVKGSLNMSLEYVDGNNFTAQLSQTKKSEISAFNMTLSKLELQTVIDTKFNLVSIKGSVVANHPRLDSKGIEIQNFEIKEGKLTTFKGNGSANYKNFMFVLENLNYENNNAKNELTASAFVSMKLGSEVQKIEVDDFRIDKEGNITVGKIAGKFQKNRALLIEFEAAFEDERLAGSFNGKLGNLKLSGAMDFGSALNSQNQSYNFGYLAINTSVGASGIPIAATGLKLNEIGGKVGINYTLKNSETAFGAPKENNYVAGLKIGISDVANIFALGGEPLVEIGTDNFQFNLKGDLVIPRNGEYHVVEGSLDVQYNYPQESLKGTAEMTVRIPAKSGFLLSATPTLTFDFQKEYWSLRGHNEGLLFNTVNFNGSIFLQDSLGFRAALSGRINYSKSIEIEKNLGFWGFELNTNASIAISCATEAKLKFTDKELTSSFYMEVVGTGKLDVTGSVNYNYEAQASGKLLVAYENQKATLEGKLALKIIKDKEVTDEYSYNLKTEL